MKNYVQPGNVVTLSAPAGGVISGQALAVGSFFGIAAYTAAAGGNVEVALEGVFELPKAAGAITPGAKVFWDATNSVATGTGTGNTLVGACTQVAGANDATVRVRLNGITTA